MKIEAVGGGRGKDLALKSLEGARRPARDAVSKAENDLIVARYQLATAERNLAVARRDRDDLEKAILAVRAIPTLPLQDYRKEVKSEAKSTDVEEPHAWEAPRAADGDLCGAMVMRDGGSDVCSLPRDHPVHLTPEEFE